MSTTPQEHDKAGWLLYHSVGMFPGQQAAMRARRWKASRPAGAGPACNAGTTAWRPAAR